MRRSWSAYLVALIAVAAAIALRAALDPWLGARVPYITLFGAVIVAVWYGGIGPALAAAAAGWAAAQYFLHPLHAWSALSSADRVLELLAYVLSTALIAALGAAMHRARARAEQSEARFRGFMQNTPTYVFLKDEEGRYLFMNRAAEELVGSRDWQGKTDEELLPPEAARKVRENDRHVLETDRPAHFDLVLPRPQGDRRLYSTKFTLRDSAGRRLVGAVTVDVTGQRQSEEELQFVTDTMSAAVIRCSADARILWANRVYCEWMGRAYADVVGRPLEDVIGAATLAEIRPYIDEVLAGGEPVYERLADFPGLGRRWVGAMYTPTFDSGGRTNGWVAVVYDIHERKQAAEQLALVLDVLPAAVLRCSRDRRYMWINSTYAKWIGRPAEQIVGLPLETVLGEAAMRELEPHIARVLAGEQVAYERLSHYPALGARWVRGTLTPITEAGAVAGWVAIVSDIHERKTMEQALRESDQRKDQFLATLAHELRNPLAPITNAVAILSRKDVKDAEMAWGRGVIERQVRQMTRLIDDLLDVARISSGKLLLRREAVTLGCVLELAIETSRPHIDAARHRLDIDIAAGEARLDADPTRLAQVFSNLLNNAAKYTEPGGRVALQAELQEGQGIGQYAVITVEDSGVGFPPELAAEIFEPFWQWSAAPARVPGGPGIGLALVRGIVELHGGSVSATSRGPAKGSRFTVRLPIAGSEAGELAQGAPKETRKTRALRVLVADDNRDAADSLHHLLGLYGHEVRVVYDGASALTLAEAWPPEVAVLDIGMPGANGYEVARALRRAHGSGVKLVALTGWGQERDRRLADEAGFDHHLTKPVDPGTLNALIGKSS